MTLTKEILQALSAEFPAGVEHYRVGPTWDADGGKMGIPLAYIDARAVMDRLDEVVGPAAWSDDYVDGPSGGTKCALTVMGVTKHGIGMAGDKESEKAKSEESDSLKRAAVKFGIGRYLYDLELPPVRLIQRGKDWVLPRDYKPAGRPGSVLTPPASNQTTDGRDNTTEDPNKVVQHPSVKDPSSAPTPNQTKMMNALLAQKFGDIGKEPGMTKARDFLNKTTGKISRSQLTKGEVSKVIDGLKELPDLGAKQA
jgi:hypothetical protein